MEFKFLLSTRNEDPHVVEEMAHKVGFDGIELMLPPERPHQRRWSTAGVRAMAVHAPNRDFQDSNVFAAALEEAITVAHQTGAKIINIHPGSRVVTAENVTRCIEIMKTRAAETGLLICCEVQARPTTNRHLYQQAYENPAAWLLDVCLYELPATVDITHIASWGERPAAYILGAGKNLRHMHISDYDHQGAKQHLLLLDGTLDLRQIFAALKLVAGPEVLCLTLEPSSHLVVKDLFGSLRENLNIMRTLLR